MLKKVLVALVLMAGIEAVASTPKVEEYSTVFNVVFSTVSEGESFMTLEIQDSTIRYYVHCTPWLHKNCADAAMGSRIQGKLYRNIGIYLLGVDSKDKPKTFWYLIESRSTSVASNR